MKSNGTSSSIPDKSLLNKDGKLFDYGDSYYHSFSESSENIDATKVGKLFFSSGSKWVNGLFALRNKVAGLLGLKTSSDINDRQKLLDNFTYEPGQQLGLFKVFNKTEEELVLGQDDKHLNFRVSLLLDSLYEKTDQRILSITTAVTFHNRFGRFYFMLVRPFHKLIVPTMLKGMIKRIENEKQATANV